MDDAPIKLRDTAPLGSGSSHSVYEHPHDPGALIKLPLDHTSHIKFRFYERRHRMTVARAEARKHLISGQIPLARYLGRVETDLGPGYVIERISDADGRLAMTAHAYLCAHGVDDAFLTALNDFLATLYTLNVVCADITLRNVAVIEGTRGLELTLVDGLGDRVIPLRVWIPPMNRYRLNRRLRRIGKGMCLEWDGHAYRRAASTDQMRAEYRPT